MIPLGILASTHHAAASEALTLTWLSDVATSNTWDGTHWNRPNVAMGPTGETRHLLIARGTGSATTNTGTVFLGGYQATLVVASPTRAFAQLFTVTIPPEAPSTGTMKHGDGIAMTHYILRFSAAVSATYTAGNLGTESPVTTSLGTTNPGLAVALGRQRAGGVTGLSITGMNDVVRSPDMWSSQVSGGESVTASLTHGSDLAGIVLANFVEV